MRLFLSTLLHCFMLAFNNLVPTCVVPFVRDMPFHVAVQMVSSSIGKAKLAQHTRRNSWVGERHSCKVSHVRSIHLQEC